jgi:type II secretory pathway pseudopilin PulG
MRSDERAFTIVELLVIISLIMVILAILLPQLGQTRVMTRRAICSSNQRQLVAAMLSYTNDYNDIFPPHRSCALNTGHDWFNLLEPYGNDRKLSHCPELFGLQTDYGVNWTWAYDAHYIGYGYNGFFLGLYSHPNCVDTGGSISAFGITTTQWTRTVEVRRPSKLIVTGDSNPKTGGFGVDLGVSLTLWWPYIYVHTEGVNDRRHQAAGVIALADGHAEVVTDVDTSIHPPFDGSLVNLDRWQP